MSRYLVWVGGFPDYEGDSLAEARSVCQEWQDQGYEDVVLEDTDNTPL